MTDLDRDLKIGVFDIEASGLKADFGYTFCIGVKEVNKTNNKGLKKIFRIDDYDKFDDKPMLKEAIPYLNTFDLLVGWYSSVYDWRFINGRSMVNNITPPAKNFRRDLCLISRGNLAFSSHRLASVTRLYFGKTEKTSINPKIWFAAIRGQKWALDYIVEHNSIDLDETERVYKRMMPLLSSRLRKGG